MANRDPSLSRRNLSPEKSLIATEPADFISSPATLRSNASSTRLTSMPSRSRKWNIRASVSDQPSWRRTSPEANASNSPPAASLTAPGRMARGVTLLSRAARPVSSSDTLGRPTTRFVRLFPHAGRLWIKYSVSSRSTYAVMLVSGMGEPADVTRISRNHPGDIVVEPCASSPALPCQRLREAAGAQDFKVVVATQDSVASSHGGRITGREQVDEVLPLPGNLSPTEAV